MSKPVVFKDGRKRCPYCNVDLTEEDYRYVCKHLNRCEKRINPYRYSDRQRGRPTNKERKELLRKRDSEE